MSLSLTTSPHSRLELNRLVIHAHRDGVDAIINDVRHRMDECYAWGAMACVSKNSELAFDICQQYARTIMGSSELGAELFATEHYKTIMDVLMKNGGPFIWCDDEIAEMLGIGMFVSALPVVLEGGC